MARERLVDRLCHQDAGWCLAQAERWSDRRDGARRRVASGEEPARWWLHGCDHQAGWYLERALRLLAGQAAADVGVAVERPVGVVRAGGLSPLAGR